MAAESGCMLRPSVSCCSMTNSPPYRIAGCLVTLYGQAVGRIVTLTVDDIRVEDNRAQARLAD
jgi:hypothetical protein